MVDFSLSYSESVIVRGLVKSEIEAHKDLIISAIETGDKEKLKRTENQDVLDLVKELRALEFVYATINSAVSRHEKDI
jgi:hypothetical protein